MHHLRAIKQPPEVALLQTAIDTTGSMFRRLLGFIKPGVWEYEIEAEMMDILANFDPDDKESVAELEKRAEQVGMGLSYDNADKLFGTFERLHSPDEFAGTGIGLATVHRIIARHEGQIWAESAPGLGASFYFTLGLQGLTA